MTQNGVTEVERSAIGEFVAALSDLTLEAVRKEIVDYREEVQQEKNKEGNQHPETQELIEHNLNVSAMWVSVITDEFDARHEDGSDFDDDDDEELAAQGRI
jgi:hypothetical protein